MIDTFTLEGKVTAIEETKEFDSGFRVREFRLCPDEEAQYPDHVTLQAIYDDCDTLLEGFSLGDMVVATFTIGGRQSKGGRFFNSLNCKKLEAFEPEPAENRTDKGNGEPPF